MSNRPHKPKRPIRSLNEAFRGLGMEPVPEGISLTEARMMREEEEGSSFLVPRASLEDERDVCDGKLCYRSKGEADRVRRSRRNSGARDLRHYFCPDCHHWHLTSRKMRK